MVKEFDRKAKIEALKVKNNRKLAVKYLEERLVGYKFQDFLEHENVEKLFSQAYSFIYEREEKKELEPILLQTNSEPFLENLILKNHLLNENDPRMILFYEYKEELDALYLSPNIFLGNINSILKFVGYSGGQFDLLYVREDLSIGICIESDEYNDRLFNWNINKHNNLV